jgi:hypothetical protein
VTLEGARWISVYDSNDASEFGSARAYLQFDLSQAGKVEVIETTGMKFQGFPAVHARYRSVKGSSVVETEELIAYRESRNIGPVFYVLMLRTPALHYTQDRAIYRQIVQGFVTLPAPKGACTND